MYFIYMLNNYNIYVMTERQKPPLDQFAELAKDWQASGGDERISMRPGLVVAVADAIGILRQDNDELREKLAESEIDPLTGAYNRARFESDLSVAQKKFERNHHHSYGILYCDLDGLKKVNDALGHDVGDLYLRSAAEGINAALRTGDIVGRYGGDELVVLVNDLDSENKAKILMKRMSISLGASFQPLKKQYDALDTGLFALSIGYSTPQKPKAGETNKERALDVLNRADQAMYGIKKSRRDTAEGQRSRVLLRIPGLLFGGSVTLSRESPKNS